jgi:hypothetical protein
MAYLVLQNTIFIPHTVSNCVHPRLLILRNLIIFRLVPVSANVWSLLTNATETVDQVKG